MFASPELQMAVAAFLYAEARLLEDNRFDEWLDCLTEDVRYSMPVRESVDVGRHDKTPATSSTFALYDDDKQSLTLRVLRLKTGQAHAEIPPTITHRQITNVYVASAPTGNDLHVNSNFTVYQERRGRHAATFYGRRADLLRQEQTGLKIARRRIELAQTILPSTISVFF